MSSAVHRRLSNMSRESSNVYKNGLLYNGFDYDLQVWVINGIVKDCSHPLYYANCCNKRIYANLTIEHAIELHALQASG